MPKPRKDQFREVIQQILYACGGNETEYTETVDVLCSAVDLYITQLTLVSAQNAESPGKIAPSDIISTLKYDKAKYNYLNKRLDDLEKTDRLKK